MNSAARLLNQSHISRTWVVSILLSNVQYGIFTLLIGVLMSSLSIVYVTNTSRTLNANLQQSLSAKDHLLIQQSQLLLEKNTWITQAHIQDVASHKLNMTVPNSHSLVIIKSAS